MNNKVQKYTQGTLILLALSALIYWQVHDPVQGLSVSLPGMDNRPEIDAAELEQVEIGEKFSTYDGTVNSNFTEHWSRFRGENFDNIYKGNVSLREGWEDTDPDIKWSVLLGEGHAAPVIRNGKVYLLDYHEAKKADALRCFSLETGKEIWRRWYNVHIKRNHGMSRTVPAVTDKYLVTVGPLGHVMCVDPDTGDFLWGIDMGKEYGAEIPFWYTGQCPLIDNDIAVLAPGGSVLLIGVDCATGEVLWETPNPDGWTMSHASIMPMEYKGVRMYVYAAIGGICGVEAEGNKAGSVVWKTNEFAPSVVAPSPLVLEDGKILITAGYGAGSMLFQLVQNKSGFTVEVLQKFKPKEGLASEQQTPVFYQGHIFSILPKDAGANRNELVCCTPDDCQTFQWTSGKTERFGLGPYMVADDKFFILDDDGTLTIARASTRRFEPISKTKLFDGQDAWGPMALADGYLLVRDSKKMFCLDLNKN